jgi:serine/threonine-protein kinase
VHRDLKPQNVMVLDSERDLVKVLDFGLAKSLSNDSGTTSMTGSGALLGTPAYMSPEAALGREVDARADLYSLGCMLYVLASGRMPFYSEHAHELISMQANQVPPPPPGVPAALSTVIMRLLEKDPAKRYQTAVETREAIEAALVAGRMPSSLALDTTLPQGLPVLPASVMATTIDSSSVAAAKPADTKAAATKTVAVNAADSIAPSPAKRTIWLPLAGIGVVAIAIAIAWIALRDPPSTPTRPANANDPSATVDAAMLSTIDSAPVAPISDAAVGAVIDAGSAAVNDAAVASARDAGMKPKPTKPVKPSNPNTTSSNPNKTTSTNPNNTTPTNPNNTTSTNPNNTTSNPNNTTGAEATVKAPVDAAVALPVDAANLARPDASGGGVKTPW